MLSSVDPPTSGLRPLQASAVNSKFNMAASFVRVGLRAFRGSFKGGRISFSCIKYPGGIPASHVRCASTAVSVEREGPLAIMILNRKPVNSFSGEFLQEINETLVNLENDTSCQGLIVGSALPKVYSAGLDLVKELYNPADKTKLADFWRSFQQMWLNLYGSRLNTMAAVMGHAMAGGCVLALSCDYRVLAQDSSIAMVETMAGVPVPPWVYKLIVSAVGSNEAEQMCLTSQLYPADKAVKVGLAHKVTEKEKVLEETRKEMEKWLKIPDKPRALTKEIMRREAIENLLKIRDQDTQNFVDLITQDAVQQAIGEQIQRMSKPKK